MHNKSWIADNRIAIVGGRNLGNEYFGASKGVNFVDLDFAMVGPVVRDASASFDRYWNSQASYPMALLAPDDVTTAALDALRKSAASRAAVAHDHPFAVELRNSDAIQRLVAGDCRSREFPAIFSLPTILPKRSTLAAGRWSHRSWP